MSAALRIRPARATLLALAAALLLAGPVACGKKGAPEPAEGFEDEYSWPQAYPAPIGVLPRGAAPPEAEEEEAEAAGGVFSPPPQPDNDALSPFPTRRSRTTTIGPVTSE